MTPKTRYRKCKQCKRLTLPDEFNKGDKWCKRCRDRLALQTPLKRI